MKKLLGLLTLMMLAALTACGGATSGVIVCSEVDEGFESDYHIYYESGYVTEVNMIMRLDLSELSEEEREMFEMMAGMEEEGVISEIDGDIWITESRMTVDEIGLGDMLVDDLIADLEMNGLTCE